MTWNTVTVAADRLAQLLRRIRSAGGTVTSCRPCPDGVHVTWTTP